MKTSLFLPHFVEHEMPMTIQPQHENPKFKFVRQCQVRFLFLFQTTCCASLTLTYMNVGFAATSTYSQHTISSTQKPFSRTGKFKRSPESVQISKQSEVISVAGRSRTSRKDAALQKTPSSASLLSAARLERLGVQSTKQLARLTPNLYIPNNMPGYSVTNYFIRGIGEIDPQGEPSVGTYIDGVYLPRNMGNMQELLDIENIEIDRGPVTSIGHQSEGGAVHINTVVPTNKRRVIVQTGYGTYNEWQIGVAASGAILKDKIYGSIAFDHHGRGGIDHNYAVNKDTNNIDYTQARGKLRFTPNQDWDITLAFDGTVDGSTNRGTGNLLNYYKYGNYNPAFPKNNYNQAGFNGNVRYTISPSLTFFSITGIRGYDDKGMYDNYGDIYSRGSQYLYYKDRMYSEELRLHGDYGKVDFNVGAYFLYENWITSRNANNTYGTMSNTPALIRYMPVNAAINQINRNWALYGETHYHITPTVTFTAGLRFNWENHSNSETLSYLAGGNHITTVANQLATLLSSPQGGVAWIASGNKSYVQLLPKGSISWQIFPQLMAYASISQGGKSGGYDYRAQSSGATGSIQASIPFKPELVTTYEVGIKSDPLPGRVRFNAALFWNQFNDIQLTTLNPSNGLTRRFNAGTAHSTGAEIETSVKITKDLDLHYTASYLYSVLDKFKGNATHITLADGSLYNTTPYAGAPLPWAPRFQTAGSLTYHIPVPLPGTFVIGTDVSFQTGMHTSSLATRQDHIPAQTYVNAMISWTSPDTRWQLQAQGRNLLDRRYLQGTAFTQGNGVPIYYSGYFSDPRTIYVTARFTL